MKQYAPIATVAIIAAAVAPTLVASLVATVLIFGGISFAGAWLVDRFGDLPGDDRRCA